MARGGDLIARGGHVGQNSHREDQCFVIRETGPVISVTEEPGEICYRKKGEPQKPASRSVAAGVLGLSARAW
jgi:hypothetical protein